LGIKKIAEEKSAGHAKTKKTKQKKNRPSPPAPSSRSGSATVFHISFHGGKRSGTKSGIETTQGVDHLTFEREMDDHGKYPAGILIPKNSCTRRPLQKKIHAYSVSRQKYVIRSKINMHAHIPRKIFLVH